MNRHALQNGVVFLQLKTLCSVLAVLGGDIAARAGHTRCFVLCAFEDDLNAVSFSFLCHLLEFLKVEVSDFCQIAFCDGVFDCAVEAFLIDDAKSLCRQVQNNPRIFFNPVELLCEEVDIETTLCATLGVRHIVAYHRFFAGDLTNF